MVDASYACAPGANGGVLQSCQGPVANAEAIDTTTAGQHTFTVTATDTDGQTATATSTYTVHAATRTRPSLTALTVSPRRFALEGRLVKGSCVKPTRANHYHRRCSRPIRLQLGYRLNLAARVTITLARELGGRLINGRCVGPTPTSRKRQHCTRLLVAPGALAINGHRAANRFAFNGRIGKHTIGLGSYRLTATPTLDGQTGTPRTITFTITS